MMALAAHMFAVSHGQLGKILACFEILLNAVDIFFLVQVHFYEAEAHPVRLNEFLLMLLEVLLCLFV